MWIKLRRANAGRNGKFFCSIFKMKQINRVLDLEFNVMCSRK